MGFEIKSFFDFYDVYFVNTTKQLTQFQYYLTGDSI